MATSVHGILLLRNCNKYENILVIPEAEKILFEWAVEKQAAATAATDEARKSHCCTAYVQASRQHLSIRLVSPGTARRRAVVVSAIVGNRPVQSMMTIVAGTIMLMVIITVIIAKCSANVVKRMVTTMVVVMAVVKSTCCSRRCGSRTVVTNGTAKRRVLHIVIYRRG